MKEIIKYKNRFYLEFDRFYIFYNSMDPWDYYTLNMIFFDITSDFNWEMRKIERNVRVQSQVL